MESLKKELKATKMLYTKEQVAKQKQKSINKSAEAEMARRVQKVRDNYNSASLNIAPNNVKNLTGTKN